MQVPADRADDADDADDDAEKDCLLSGLEYKHFVIVAGDEQSL